MIYTVTFNPAIDYFVHVGKINIGEIHRLTSEEICFGGKGVNVSLILGELGIKSKVLGFVAGFTGKAIEEGISEKGVETDFVHLDSGFSRINVKIRTEVETDFNGQGPKISKGAIEKLYKKLGAMQEGDVIVLAGSIPAALSSSIYEEILDYLSGKGIRAVVDATGNLLLNVLKYKPFLVKPNNYELGEMFGVTLSSDEEIIHYAGKLKSMGAANVLVSMAGDGAILLDENGAVHRCGVCKGTVKNSVGAGDSMVAGFLAGCQNGDYDYALKLGTAAGGATAFSNGLAKREDIFKLLEQL